MTRKLTLIAMLLAIFSFGTIAFAQTSNEGSATDSTAEGLTVSPPTVELNLEPGNVYQKTVKITNPTDNLIELYPIAMNFGAKDETGTPTFYAAEDDSYTFSMAKWIEFKETKIALTSQQVVDFKYSINVPADAEPGGHYGVLFFSTKAPELSSDQSQVAISSQVGVLILGKVAGDIKEEGSVAEFATSKDFYFKPPVDMIARIHNSGNIHFKPKGDIIIKNMFGKEIGKVAFNETAGNVLPDSTRKFDIQWNPDQSAFYKIPIGRFTANLAATFGDNNQNLTGVDSFWIVPLWFIITVGVVILLIIILIIWGKRRKKGQLAAAEENQPEVEQKVKPAEEKKAVNNEQPAKEDEEINISEYTEDNDSEKAE